MKEFVTKDTDQTLRMGRSWAWILAPGDTLAFTGVLGSGKTVLIRGIIEGLGVKDRVQSPSFVLIRSYAGRFPVKHVDLYRLNTQEVDGLYLEEIFDSDGIMLVEWAERASFLPGLVSKVRIELVPGQTGYRNIQLNGPLAQRFK